MKILDIININGIDSLFTASVAIMAIVIAYKQIVVMYFISNEKYNTLLLENGLFQKFKERHRKSIKFIIIRLIVIFIIYAINDNIFDYYKIIKFVLIIALTTYTLIKLIIETEKLFNIYGTTYSKHVNNKKHSTKK